MNDLICAKLKEIFTLQDIIIKYDWNNRLQRGKMLITYCFLKDIHEGLGNMDLKQSNFMTELKNFEKGTKSLEEKSFLNNLGLLFSPRKNVFNSFKSRLFPIKNVDKILIYEPIP